jgi:hypothetical protein
MISYPSILLIGIGIPFFSTSQDWDCIKSTTEKSKHQLKLNLNGGIASNFGDLSIYDLNPDSKILTESGPGFGIIGTWYVNHIFGISGQLLEANIKSAKDNVSFRTRIMEYNIHGRINFMNLFQPYHNPKFGFEGYAGIGQFFYTVIKFSETESQTEKTIYPVKVPEFVYFFGCGISYKISKYLSATADLAIRQCQTDRLDEVVRNNDFDYYSYLSLGLTLDISRLIYPDVKSRYKLKRR